MGTFTDFAATALWSLLFALFALFAALLAFPDLDASILASLAILVSALLSGYALASRRRIQPGDVQGGERGRALARFAVVWLLGYGGGTILSSGRDVPALVLHADTALPFDPRWAVVYLTAFPMVVLPYLALERSRDLQRYLLVHALTIATSAVAFVAYPLAVARPSLDGGAGFSHWALGLVYAFDSPRNTLPSLHAGLGLSACIFGFHVRRNVGLAFAAVFLAFLLSAIVIRQHVLVDLIAGGAVALCAYTAVVRIMPAVRRAATPGRA
jgi:hypothetical protein